MPIPKPKPTYACIGASAGTYAISWHALGPSLGGPGGSGWQGVGIELQAEASGARAEAAGGGPSHPSASGADMWGAFEVITTQVEAPWNSPRRKPFVFQMQGEIPLHPGVSTKAKLCGVIPGRIKDQLFSIAARLCAEAGLQHERLEGRPKEAWQGGVETSGGSQGGCEHLHKHLWLCPEVGRWTA